ncbi:tol-pal system protein YbgF [Thiocapsa imhoffii]|uniref:Cell division coordinator CpoB n=1 Tax=Thiocapsa imhoffii TaxID=382777 RepID=A0A9X0WH56_9GAMM|nr:tol-pal system protein YbgF [Thiocapsa imhoffii]MBK1644440.1 tol-pal system protein YbgF [Thiocapsa imhoffii]
MDSRSLKCMLARGLITAALALALPAAAVADPMLEGRIARIERILDNQAGSELLLQMQQMQMEMQELRGLVELQHFEIQRLQRQQRGQFIDGDSRLGSERDDPPDARFSDGTPVDPNDPSDLSLPGALDLSVSDPARSARPTASGPTSSAATGIPSLPSPETSGGSERDSYAAAFELLKDRQFEQAQEAFNDLLRRYPQGQFTDNARYWLAETYYAQRNYPAAMAEFDRLVQLNSQSPKVPGALLKIGSIQAEQEDLEQARAIFQEIINRYPRTTEARLARSRLDQLGAAPR